MEATAVDVEVDISAVEIWGAGFPYFYLRMHGFYGFPDGLADSFALNTHLYIEECKFTQAVMMAPPTRWPSSLMAS